MGDYPVLQIFGVTAFKTERVYPSPPSPAKCRAIIHHIVSYYV